MAHHASLSVMLRIKSGTAGKGERISASRQRALKFQTILIDFPPPTFAIKSAYTSRRKEGRKEGFRPVSTKIPRPCTGYPAEWIPGGRVGGLCSKKGKCRNREIWIKNYRIIYKVWLDK